MTWAMAELTRNPQVIRKFNQKSEPDIEKQQSKNHKLRSDQLSYLKMATKETWRLHSVSPLVPREVTYKFKINGYT